jgi:3-hydroxyacyl-[acyl-carrier-protein] dehydratase
MRWLFLERIDELVPGKYVRGTAVFPAELKLFEDHFPRFPVVPGVLLLETLAQLAGKGIGYTVRLQRGDWPFPVLSMMQAVKFRRFVKPGERVSLEAEFDRLLDNAALMKVKARTEHVVAQAEQTFVFNAVPLDDPKDRAFVEESEAEQLGRLWPAMDAKVWKTRPRT